MEASMKPNPEKLIADAQVLRWEVGANIHEQLVDLASRVALTLTVRSIAL